MPTTGIATGASADDCLSLLASSQNEAALSVMNALNRFLILNRKNFKFTRAVDAGRGHG